MIDGLNSGESRIAYRDSKLTRLLQDSLGGTANHAIMICCIAPFTDVASETCQSLSYAAKVSPIMGLKGLLTMVGSPGVQRTDSIIFRIALLAWH